MVGLQGRALTLTLVALALVPCAVAILVHADGRLERVLAQHHERRLRRRLDRVLGVHRAGPVNARTEQRPGIEWIAAELRRLDWQRRGLARESVRWHQAVLRAYDIRLQLASRCLGVDEHLDQLEGIDREIERVRVESQLEAAGLALRWPATRHTER